ncbi:hypothetical protein [Bradyrhizobium viridifuturi]|uniref:hypothetical protein n=1 Tax=Bradyrhizobium viridifuturi TaxID=1654716 RepID=UPI000FE14100|nr:hypothetical protein [Bradyrhizobium viridifuturi]
MAPLSKADRVESGFKKHQKPEKFPSTSSKPLVGLCRLEILEHPQLPTHLLKMSSEDYLERAEHYRRAKESAVDDFTRYYLERMERSYRVLADSHAVLDRSKKTHKH